MGSSFLATKHDEVPRCFFSSCSCGIAQSPNSMSSHHTPRVAAAMVSSVAGRKGTPAPGPHEHADAQERGEYQHRQHDG